MRFGTKLILLMITITGISVAAVGYLSYQVGRSIIDDQIQQVLSIQTDRTLESINKLIFDRQNDMQLMIADSTLTNPNVSNQEKTEVLKNKLINLGWYDQFHLTNKQGDVIASTNSEALGENFSGNQWYKITEKEFIHVTDAVSSPTTKEKVLIFTNTVQDNDNNVLGYLVAEFSLDIIKDLLKNTPENFEAYLISGDGLVIAQKGPPITTNKSISPARIYQKPSEYLQQQVTSEGYFSFDGNNWQVAVQILSEIAYEPIRDFTYLLMVFASLILMLVMILGHFSSKEFVRPILLLTEGVAQMRQGDLKQQVEVKNKDEVGFLAKSFNAMTLEIDQKTNNLIEEKGKYKTILESTNEGIILFNPKNKAIAYNKEFEGLFLKNRRKNQLKAAKDILNTINKNNVDEESKKAVDILQKIIKESDLKKQITTQITLKKPFYAILALYTKPVIGANGKLIGRIWVFNDITKEIESEKSKHQFIHVASHKLRTPITAVNWNSQILLDGTFGEITEDQKETLKVIKNASDNLNSLSNILINVAEIKKDKIPIKKETFELKQLIEPAIAKGKSKAEDNEKLTFKAKLSKKLLSTKIKADPKKIDQVLSALIDNAARYQSQDKKNTIELSAELDLKGKKIIITVKDHGLGMNDEEKSRVFTKFFRSDKADLSYPDGTGLSLYLAKIIIKSSKEKIWFESEEGKGTRFHFTLTVN